MRNFRLSCLALVVLLLAFCCASGRAQSDAAEISGRVTDPTGALIPGATVQLRDIARGTVATTKTNREGIYAFPFVQPGRYSVSVGAGGFKSLDLMSLTANAQDHIEQNFRLPVGAPSESVTVSSEGQLDLDTSVSTSVDQNFVENMPLNGQSIQQLIAITPGVQRTAGAGQFSFNGVRDNQNYITVDGISANTGTLPSTGGLGQQGAGQVGGYSALLTSSSLASLGDIQEIKIQSSSYSAEFGRGGGGQISITTQSGTNSLHGRLFEYLRNEDLDAYSSYTKYQYAKLLATSTTTTPSPLTKPKERQSDFGGTLGGAIVVPHLYDGHNRSFFFGSFEGLILQQPISSATNVTGTCARLNNCTTTGVAGGPPSPSIDAALLPYLLLAPPPNYVPATITSTTTSQYFGTYSNPSTAYATSLRLTHQLNSRVQVFARALYSPSELKTRQANNVTDTKFNQKSYTLGVNSVITSRLANEFRLNYTRNTGDNVYTLDTYGGGTAPTPAMQAQMFPSQYGSSYFSDNFTFSQTLGGQWGSESFQYGTYVQNTQRQLNLVDHFSWALGKHQVKFGGDWRRLTPIASPFNYGQQINYYSLVGAPIVAGSSLVSGLASGIPDSGIAQSQDKVTVLINDLSFYAQDTWRLTKRLTANYGVRWDIDPAPRGDGSQQLYAVTNVTNVGNATLAPAGTPLYATNYAAFQPRAGLVYEFSSTPNWATVLRTGGGLYYDTNANVATNATSYYPHERAAILTGASWPTSALPPPPAVNFLPPYTNQNILGFDQNWKTPANLDWNLTLEQGVGRDQAIRLAYVGSAGRRLTRFIAYNGSLFYNRFLNLAEFSSVDLSNYDSFQVSYLRRLSKGLQVLANYTLAKSLDTNSNETTAVTSSSEINPATDYGLSTFDVRNNFNASVAYDIPTIQSAWTPVRYALRDWSVDEIFLVHSGNPLTATFSETFVGLPTALFRPNLVAGQPLWVSSANNPDFSFPSFGGKVLNVHKFDTSFAKGAIAPLQGSEPRGYIQGLAVRNLDMTLRREFKLPEGMHLQFRADAFNVLNQTLYANPNLSLGTYSSNNTVFNPTNGAIQFGAISNTLNGTNTAGVNNLGGGYYGIGRNRSLQVALKLKF
jgi:hypothetical protein